MARAAAVLPSFQGGKGIDITKLRPKGSNSKVTVVIGAQWGDEGKGKIVDFLSANSNAVCRCQVRVNIMRESYYFFLTSSVLNGVFK